MKLEHQFTVPASPDVTWAAVIDPARVAPCMPGAALTEAGESEFSGTVKVKLGPVSLLYKGSGQFIEVDEQARRVVIKASGKDSRGNGTAAATVTVTLRAEGTGTHGDVVTDLAITGKPAQFGRGMISEVGGKILDTFAANLAKKLSGDDTEPATPTPAAADTAAEPAAEKPAPRRRTSATSRGTASATAKADAANGASSPGDVAATGTTIDAAAAKSAADTAAPKAAAKAPEPPSAPAPPAQPAAPPAPKPALRAVDSEPETEAIDLMDYAGASIAKRAVPAAAALVLLLIIWRIIRSRRS